MTDLPPIPSATIILLRDSLQGVEALIMRRNSKMNFLGGFWVFPGGAVEEVDQAESQELTYLNAAVRETQEEAGLDMAADSLLPVSRWITPVGAPKRFDTRFYIGKVEGQDVQHDGEEMTSSLWVKPGEAIERHRQKDIEMLPPTVISLLALQDFASVDEVLEHYRNKEPLYFLPKACFHQEQLVMLYPGDAGYETQEPGDETARHRCLHTPEGWQYINEIGVCL